ncbi:DUF6884 domain-containing protein [Fusobacterium necrophorum]|uniref:DUF6884 domain-containing protein n=2 Tax=Fusobacterium necrophorum TaxID=859 RepID=A0AAN3VX70_9FUSO|nr:DUF6884 domain-containing protein [Fusobacterium necrophorum]AYV94728.1 hypothetical protein BWX37_03445 [Fusobacterium necrophorum subsp. funduliforme]EJU18791.1 hypothetical protein HMPREF1127_1042 [Fusobacterium necrophorum subsp. funduliforme Fnf 1007]KYL02973.1 hypothetical protein A2J06_09950 [Fusobacterium necrophorum subsp. funduliforme]KYM37707.1 hypothetical protein A2U03_10845 [Fusobacterium necrophorum subsp. funduliforme]KYM52218.1 hypothetical protein A2U04_10385 [Fusobacteriu
MRKIVLINCVKKKRAGKHKAKDLYVSTLFRYQLKYAKLFSEEIYILSAKYGLLELDDYIESYDLTLNNMSNDSRKKWTCKVLKQLQEKNITKEDRIVFLCGKKYLEYLAVYFKNNEIPLKTMGLGERLRFLKKEIMKRRRNERK